jgi:hypothetical protein
MVLQGQGSYEHLEQMLLDIPHEILPYG